MKTKLSMALIILSLLTLVGGCSKAPDFSKEGLLGILPGKTTMEEVISKFGEPDFGTVHRRTIHYYNDSMEIGFSNNIVSDVSVVVGSPVSFLCLPGDAESFTGKETWKDKYSIENMAKKYGENFTRFKCVHKDYSSYFLKVDENFRILFVYYKGQLNLVTCVAPGSF